jgi:alpha-glucosidase (family GH31 glycosyl hydrolase)
MLDLNLYGDQPIFITLNHQFQKYNGYIFWNSNAKSFTFENDKVTIRAAGGIIDLFVIAEDSPEMVIKQIHRIIGQPVKPPLWSFGYHLCRWGYNSSEETLRINSEMYNAKIPQEVQWNDIDYMDRKRDFTFDPNSFKTLPSVINAVHNRGQKYIVILDPAISIDILPDEKYYPLEQGLE